MKNLLFLLLFVLCTPALLAQSELRGLVTYQNTGKRMEAIQVTARGASPTITKATTDGKGVFKLVFPNKQPGESVVLNIENRRYDLVNHVRELEVLLPTPEEEKQVRLVVCNKGERDANAVKYYEISTDYITKNYNRELNKRDARIAAAKSQLEQGKITQTELEQQINTINAEKAELYEQYKRLNEEARALAEKFTKVDLAQVDSFYRQAFELFQAGKIDEAIEILESDDRLEGIENLKDQDTKLKKEEADLKRMEDALRKIKEQQKVRRNAIDEGKKKEIDTYIFQADLLKLKFDFEGVEKVYEDALSLDSENIYLLDEAALFCYEQNNYLQAKDYWEKAKKLVEIDAGKAHFINNLALLYNNNQELVKADSYYQEALKIRRFLVKKNPDIFSPDLAATFNNFGSLYYKKQELTKAKEYYQEALKIYRNFAKKDPDTFLPSLATILNNLGSLHDKNQELIKADSYYQEALKIRRFLVKKNPNTFLPDVAMTLNNLGILYKKNQELIIADSYYQEALKIYKNLAEKNPDAFLPNVAKTLNNLGNLYNDNQKLVKADSYYQEALKIRRFLVKKNPDAFLPNVAKTLNNLGVLYENNQELAKANSYYREALKIYRNLARKNPGAFSSGVAAILNNFGSLYFGNQELKKADSCYQETLEIYRNLAEKNPDAFLPDVAKTLNNLGVLYKNNQELAKADSYYREALKVYRNLAEKNPRAFNLNVIMISLNIVMFYQAQFSENEDETLCEKSLVLLKDIKIILETFEGENISIIQRIAKDMAELSEYFTECNNSKNNTDNFIEKLTGRITHLKQTVEQATIYADKAKYQQELVTILQELLNLAPDSKEIKDYTANAYGSLAWYQLFVKDLVAAEQSARTALQLNEEATWVNTNLALALLYQGKYKVAKNIYEAFMDIPYSDSTYRSTFLADLEALEAEGITHKDVKKIRSLLEE